MQGNQGTWNIRLRCRCDSRRALVTKVVALEVHGGPRRGRRSRKSCTSGQDDGIENGSLGPVNRRENWIVESLMDGSFGCIQNSLEAATFNR